ncbi:radical SAM protein [Candidatus Pacearchaeota archaeon]|nr:radical SAM protein [Candidatus Pacearchaeota archaeon]
MDIKSKANIFFKYVLIRPMRVLNLFLIYFSKFFKLTRVLGKPLTAMIEPTNYCNLNCPLCPTGEGLLKRKPENLSLTDFKKIMDNLGDSIIHLRLWNWGEPFLNKDFYKMVEYAKSKNIFVNTSTNSYFLNEEMIDSLIDSELDQLIISLDGASEETYNKYRKKGDFNKVIKSLEKIKELKNKKKTRYPEVKIQFIVMRHNEHEIKKVIELAKKTEVDTLFFKTVGIMDEKLKDKIYEYLPRNNIFQRYMLEESEVKEIKLSGKVCDYLWSEITINVDGSVVPCCRDAQGKHILGNIKKQKISDIWNSKKMVSFRKQVLRNKDTINICKTCSGSNKEFTIKEIKIKK